MIQNALKNTAVPYGSERRLKQSLLACPDCHRTLLRKGVLHCDGCGGSWKEVGGVPNFSSGAANIDHISQEIVRQTNESAQRLGWRKAVEDNLRGRHPDLFQEILSDGAADFRFILPMNSRSRVLEIGAGFGPVSFGLQPHCGWIAAIEPAAERARFMEIRRSQEALQNMEVAVAEWFALPFLPETFDFIIVNGHLTSVGLADPAESPRILQVRFLSQLIRLIRPGGALYLGAENRFDLIHLNEADGKGTGSRPGRLKTGGKRYGKEGYRELLAESGFSEVQFFMPYPDYRRPATMISLDHPDPLRFFLKHSRGPASRIGRLKRRIASWGTSVGLGPFIPADFSIVAWKEGRYD